MAISYHLEYREVGQSAATRVEGISATNHVITGLSQVTDYEYRVREVDTTNGILTWSKWTDWGGSFTTLAASGVDVNVGAANETDSAPSITASTDSTPPVITLNGGADIVIPLGVAWSDPGATVTDNVDPTTTIYSADSVDINTAASYTLNYDYTDAGGNAATTVQRTVRVAPEAPATSFNIEYREDGGATTQVLGVTDSFLVVTGLTDSTLHEYRVQGVGDTGALSEWSAWTQFTTDALAHVEANVGAANETDSAGSVSPNIDADTSVNVGSASETDSSTTVIADTGLDVSAAVNAATETNTAGSATAQIDSDTSVNVGAASETDTAPATTAQIDAGSIPAEAFDIEIENLITNDVTYIDNASTDEFYTATSLTPGTRYRFRVRGRTAGGSVRSEYSAWSDVFVTHFAAQSSTKYGPASLQLDSFWIGLPDESTDRTVPDILGTVSDPNAVVTVQFNGNTYTAVNQNGNWYVKMPEVGSVLRQNEQDELKYNFAILLDDYAQAVGITRLLL